MRKLKDVIRTGLFILKNKKNKIKIGGKNIIKRSVFEGKNILSGENYITSSYIGFGTYFGSKNKIDTVRIGKYCSISEKLEIILGSHPLKKNVSTHPAFYTNKYQKFNKIELSYVNKSKHEDMKKIDNKWNVVIGNDVWIGYNVKILQGVKIGDGSVIAAGSVVTNDILPYSIVGGVPAKIIRKRFCEENIEYLLKLKWWEKEETWIKENIEYFDDVKKLKEKFLK